MEPREPLTRLLSLAPAAESESEGFQHVLAKLASWQQMPQPLPIGEVRHGLSEREMDVLKRIAAGDSNKQIARTLQLSPFTVKRHVANILAKLALARRGQAAAWWLAHSG
ncbi:MAG: LuxR C-terminal-related transcriptional regulator [Methylococcus sp.]|nr:LuxR C-terminal-related transcriptional regulator [Methylococcus sp.]